MTEKEIDSYDFAHDGKTYVIKVFHIGNKFVVKPYLNNMELGCYEYSADVWNMHGWKSHYGDKLPHVRLKEIAERSIMEGFGVRKG